MLTPINHGEKWPSISKAVVLKGSGIFVSTGHVGTDAGGNPITSSIEDQVVAVFAGIERTLQEAGLTFAHVARTTIFVASFDLELMTAIRTVRARHYDAECPPASVIVQAGLYDPALLLEAEVLAVVP